LDLSLVIGGNLKLNDQDLGLVCRGKDLRFKGQGLRYGVQGSGFRVQGSGLVVID